MLWSHSPPREYRIPACPPLHQLELGPPLRQLELAVVGASPAVSQALQQAPRQEEWVVDPSFLAPCEASSSLLVLAESVDLRVGTLSVSLRDISFCLPSLSITLGPVHPNLFSCPSQPLCFNEKREWKRPAAPPWACCASEEDDIAPGKLSGATHP